MEKAFNFFCVYWSFHAGFIVRWKIFDPPSQEQMYDDDDFWEVRYFSVAINPLHFSINYLYSPHCPVYFP